MPYKVRINAPDESWIEDRVFDTYEEADEYGLQCLSNASAGADVLSLSNPGDYDSWEDQEDKWDYDIIKVKK